MTKLEPVRSLWIGESLPAAQQACVRSFLHVGHPFELFTYDEVKDVPSGTHLRSAAEIVPRERMFTYSPASGRAAGGLGGFSNVFRYSLLAREGGYWVDADMFCLRPFPTDPLVISTERQKDGSATPNCGVLKCPSDHPFARYCLEQATSADPATLQFGAIGPALVAAAVRELDLLDVISPPHVFCGISWFEHLTLYEPGSLPEGALALHLWGEMWRRKGKEIPWPPPAGSPLYDAAAAIGECRAEAAMPIEDAPS